MWVSLLIAGREGPVEPLASVVCLDQSSVRVCVQRARKRGQRKKGGAVCK